ncbi:FkbM family methyltransferase [Pseudooceanicola sp.]|uniref:FkbM family methyltransferase n=1 Tax=Pseudooceanicola sp. TaxID=1914328 RepID=UPI0035C67E10
MTDAPYAAICKGIKVPPSPYLTETRIKRIEEARYEGEEIAGALSVVGPEDRVLELGAGLGIVGAVTAHNARPEAVLSFEANPGLVPHIRALYALNGLDDRIEVRNELLISGPDRPESMTFHVHNSYLGSSLIDRAGRKTTPVEVPTSAFDAVRAEFAPTVLIMDIEGGELEFLAHADLRGIRAVVIEFHPGVYGVDGMKTCKDALRRAGFAKVKSTSTRFVWTCTRDDAAFTEPRPEGGWTRQIVSIDNGVVVPPDARSHVQTTGVLTSTGTAVPHAALWRGQRLLTERPEMPDTPAKRLPGKWLWGGVMWRYFPHFITESITRLWALDRIDQSDLSGILFVPKSPENHDEPPGFQRDFFRLMGTDLPLVEAREPLSPDLLIVPGQGFGLGDITRGTLEFRAAVRNRFALDVRPEGPGKLYISRSRLGPQRGALLGETFLDAYLAREGYEIFHPQEHPLEVQIARYRAATHVIAAEGSSLHLYAFAGRPDAKVAMLLRRKSRATQHIATHIESFTGVTPRWIEHLRQTWKRVDTPRKRLHISEPDFAAIQTDLRAGGFISGTDPTWAQPSQAELQALLGTNYELA